MDRETNLELIYKTVKSRPFHYKFDEQLSYISPITLKSTEFNNTRKYIASLVNAKLIDKSRAAFIIKLI